MDSWVLEGDSYSFLRSAPRNFNLPHQDGPNRVEIFDITSIQSHRSAISETTCLCDIFGDDSESPSLSSSPASASYLKKDTDEQLPVEDVNDSSGSYHTANGSEHLSDGSEIYEDSKDTKDLVLSETLEANVQASDLPAAHKCDAPAPIRNWQVSDLSQDTNLTQVKNSSDHQLATSTSEFRDTNIRVTGSPQEIFCLELLSENKTITDQSHATSFELRRTNSSEEITTYNPKHITKQGDAFSSEQKKKNSAENIITPDSSLENGSIIEQRGTMTSEVREPDIVQENTHYKQSIFSQNQTSSESYPSNLTSEDSTKGNNDQVCLIEEGEKISLPDILSIENSLLVCGTVQSDSSVALTNVSNDGSVFTSLQKAGVSDRSAQDNTHDLTEMSTPLEHEDVPNELPYAGAFLCDNKAGMSDLPDPNGEPVPEYIEDNTKVDVGYMPQDINISSDTNRTLSSFSDPREELVSSVISEVYTPTGLSGDVNFPELPVIIHSPVGFTICPSPEPESNLWSEELAFTSRTPESDYRLTPTDKGSVSSFDSNLCPTPEPRSISSTSDNRQNVIICDPNPAASSLDLRSASCSPEIQITPCSFLSSQNDFSSPDEVLEQPHDLAGIIHAEMSSTLPTKEAGDFSIPIIYNLSSAQDATSSPSTIFPRDTVFPGVKERCIESPTLNILPTNEITNISSNLSICPYSTLTTESPNVHKIPSVESYISTMSSANETISPDSNLLPSTEEHIYRSPSTLSIPRDTTSSDIVETGFSESSVSPSPTKDIEKSEFSSPTLQPLLTEGGISRPPLNVCTPLHTASPDVDGLICVKSAASTTLLTNETTIMAVLPHSPTLANVSIRKDTMLPDVEETRYPQTPMSTMLPIKEITPIPHISSKEGGSSRSVSTLSIPEDTVSPDVAGRCVESFMPTIMPTNETTNMSNLLISNSSSTLSGISRPSSSLNIPIQCNTASNVVDGLGCVEIPTSATALTDEKTNTANSPIDPSLTEGISRPPSNLIIPRDTMCLDAEVTKYPEGSNEISMNKMTNMAISPIFDHSTDEETSRPASISIDVDLLRCVECPTSSILPPNEAPNMEILPVFNISPNISPTEGCLCNPPSTLGIPKDTMFPEVEGRRNPEKLNEIPINEITNMNISPLISNLSSTERELSRPPSLNISRNTSSTDVEALRYIESPTSTILPTNEVSNMGISPVFNISSTVEGSSTSPSSLSLPRVTMSSNIKERRHTETLIEMPINETTNLPNSPIISNLSLTEKEISRPQSISNISRNTSTDVDALRPTSTSIDVDICVGSATSTILPTNQTPNMGISSFFNISSTVEGSSTPPLALCLPRDSISFDVDGRRTSNGITTLASSTMLPTNIAISSIDNFSSTAGGTVPRQSSNLGLPSDSTSPGVQGTRDVERSNEVSTNDNKSIASSMSSFATPLITLTDRVSCPKTSYQKTPDRFNDYIPTPEYTHNHLLTIVNEKVDLRSVVPVDRGQIDYTGSKMDPQDDCMDSTLVHYSQTEKISETSSEPPAPKLSVKQIKESWERMNESILNSLKPWQTSKKKAKEAKERNDIGKEMLQRESAGSEKTFRQMAVRPGESPSVLHSNDHTMYEGQSCRNKGWSGERVLQEECTLGRGVGNIAEGSHRGEQVELSFSTRNRKGPAHHSPTPPSRDPKSGIPPRYFESPLATRRQQSLLRAQNIQKENKTGARRVRSTSQSNPSAAGRLFSECTSETSSMGSEFDDSDCEVKWLTDQAFRSLSSPRVDYLDVYNSSRGSSTNVSQPSTTMDSPGSATWITYADLHDSLHENDEGLCHPSPFLPHGTLDPAKRFEMSSFECVDVALESKEETRKGKRTVPKRQIQFKKRNEDELKSTENEGSAMDLLSTETCSMNTFVRQHSTPASMQEDLLLGENEIQTGKKMLQKSASLDESSPKSKIASSVIKSVLSKKMDAAPKEPPRTEPCENKNEHVKTLTSGDSCNLETQRSSLPSVCSLPSEDFAGKEERSPYTQRRIRGPKVPPKPAFKPTFLLPNNIPVDAAFQNINLKDQITPIKVDTLESKLSKKQSFGSSEKEASKVGDKYNSDSGSAINQTTNCTAICVASTQRRMTTSDNKHPMTPETCKQLEGSSSMFLSKTPEITLKPCTIKDKNKSTLKASVCPDSEISKDSICEPVLELKETAKEQKRFKPEGETDTEEDNENNKAKSVIHKVRDVRKLVKNTYNLSFKASNNTNLEEFVVSEKQNEMQPEHSHSLQIECKAISLKDKSASSNKSTMQQDAGPFADAAKIPQTDSLIRKDVGITKAFVPNIQHSDMDLFVGLDKSNNIPTPDDCEQDTKLEMPSRPSSKEVSTLVFLQDGAPKSVQKPPSPASTNVKTANSSHSVSMLRKEKGMQTDIGVCDVLSEGTGSKLKHINRLEVPLQTYASEGNSGESRKVKKEDADSPPEQKTFLNSGLQSSGVTPQVRSSSKHKEVKALPSGKEKDNQRQQALKEDISVVSSSKAEVRAFSSSTKIHAMPVTTSKEIELPIQVRSISSDRAKPSVLPKPSYKQPFAEIRSTSTDLPKSDNTPTTSILKEQTHLKSDVEINDVKTSTAVKHNEQTTNTASSNIKTLAVSAVSSHKPQNIPYTISSAQKSTATSSKQEVSITSVQNSSNKQQQNIQEQVMVATSCASNYQTLPAASQANTYIQPEITPSSNKQLLKKDFHFPTSDDPPSYDERESFSPLQLSDLPSRRQNRYHPTTKHSLCSCTACTNPQFGQPYHGSQNQTPPVPCSPSQVTSYTGAPPQAQVRPHQCRTDGQPSTYPSLSPKTTVQQTPTMIQPIHHSHTCPASAIQPFGNEQQQPSTQHMDRHLGNQRSPQAPSGATYREHSRSPNIACLDPRSQFFNTQELPSVFGNEYGSDGSGNGGMLYPENASGLGYGQGPRRVLLDPETGKYFYIEVPMQPLRKMLFDPEIGQYVEVLIPQQALSNSSMYPPTAAPYQGTYHGQGLYTSQYLPYAMPPHTQSAQQPRHPEPSVPTSLHQNTMGYGSSASQAPKSEVKGHPSLNQGYLESMYYIPTGMNASPNSTPSDCYHKPATNMPAATGGRRA